MSLDRNARVNLSGAGSPPGHSAALHELAGYCGSEGAPLSKEPGTAYTFTADDVGGYKRFLNGGTVTATIAADADQPMPDNAEISFEQAGTGTVTVAAADGVTLNAAGGKVATTAQFSVGTLKRTGLNVWTLFGNLS